MVKLGFNMLLWSTHVTEAHFAKFETLKKIGYDGIEIPVFEGDPEHFRKVGRALADQGLDATAVTVMPDADHDAISDDSKAREGAVAHIAWAAECAQAAGAGLLAGPLHQALGRFSGTCRDEGEWARGVETLREAADKAQACGVALSIEPLNRFECYFLNLQEDASAFVRDIGKANVGILYDTFHANIEEKDPVGAITANIADINHVHASATDRGTPGRDHAPWAETFKALKSGGYDGWLTIEAFGRALPDLAAATRCWRDFFEDEEEVYTVGYRTLREGWDKA